MIKNIYFFKIYGFPYNFNGENALPYKNRVLTYIKIRQKMYLNVIIRVIPYKKKGFCPTKKITLQKKL